MCNGWKQRARQLCEWGMEWAKGGQELPLGNAGRHGGHRCTQADAVILCERSSVARHNWM